MVGREELQAKEAGAFTWSGALLLTAETVHKEPWCSTPREDGVRRRTTEDRHLHLPCRFQRHVMVIDASLFGNKGVCEELRCRCSGFVFRRFLQSEGFRSVWCGFSGIVLGCLLQSCKVTALVAKELVLGWAKADAAKRAAPAWVPCDVEKMMMW